MKQGYDSGHGHASSSIHRLDATSITSLRRAKEQRAMACLAMLTEQLRTSAALVTSEIDAKDESVAITVTPDVTLLAALRESGILEFVMDALRNDAMTEIQSRYAFYSTIVHFLEQLVLRPSAHGLLTSPIGHGRNSLVAQFRKFLG